MWKVLRLDWKIFRRSQNKCMQKKIINWWLLNRWNSTYLIFERAYDLKDAISRLVELDNMFKHAPSIEEWKNVEVIMECFEVFYDVTENFSGSKCPTANIYFNDICTIYFALKEWLHNPYPFLVSMAVKMIENFEKYWKITNIALAIASILNSCCKMKSVNYFFNLIYGAEFECELKINGISNVLRSLYNEYAVCHSQPRDFFFWDWWWFWYWDSKHRHF